MAPPLRILHVQHSLEPGGMENGVVNIANALQPRGFEFHVACLSRTGDFASRMPDPALVQSLSKPDGFSLRTMIKLRRLIRQLKPDVVHSHNLGALIYAAGATLFGRTRPILHGEHGQPDDGPEAAKRDRQRRRLFRAARRVHTVSQSLLEHFLSAGFPAEKMIALVNGVDTERFKPADRDAARRDLSIPDETLTLVIVGRLIESKRHRLLFEALQILAQTHPQLLLLVVGDGGTDQAAIKEAAAASPVARMIRMEGFQADPRPYYRAADLLVAPSQIEGLSNVVLEAMACGLPPLLHDACGSDEVIDHGADGFVTDLSTKEMLAGAISDLLAGPQPLAEIGKRSRDKVVRKFSLEAMADAYENTYRQLATGIH